MPINYYTVKLHLEEKGWKLLSDTYKNLDTPLEMECPKGHKQQQTYKEWRKHMICETCVAGDPYKVKKNKVPTKRVDTYRVLALDAATNVSGYSVYDDGTLVSYGTYKTNETLDTTARINQVKHWLETAIEEWQPDFVGIEGIQLQTFGPQKLPQVELYRALANLQGVLMDTLFEHKIESDLVYSSAWRKTLAIEASGRENKKKAAQDKVRSWYNVSCTQDEADAICIGKYFVLSGRKKQTISWGEDI